jgi:hypothetical protein
MDLVIGRRPNKACMSVRLSVRLTCDAIRVHYGARNISVGYRTVGRPIVKRLSLYSLWFYVFTYLGVRLALHVTAGPIIYNYIWKLEASKYNTLGEPVPPLFIYPQAGYTALMDVHGT